MNAKYLHRGKGWGMSRLVAMVACAIMSLFTPHAAVATSLVAVRIEVPSASNLQFLTLWVALGAGYFQKEGLKPQILTASTPRATGQLLLHGDADVTVLPPPMFLGMMAENRPIVLFASLLANEPINLIARGDVVGANSLSRGTTLRARLQAIKGMKVGLAGEVAPRLRAIFAYAGMDADKDIQQIVIPGPGQVQAFADKKVDVLFAHTPYLETAIVNYGGTLLVDASAVTIPELTGGQVHALATTRELARAKPELISAVARAIYSAQKLIHSDRAAAVQALLIYGATEKDQHMLDAITEIYGLAVPETPAISLPGIERDVDLYPAHPTAPDFSKIRAADFVAPEFAARAVTTNR
jgi:NitT/TauT family transport system substrate-binding protein